METTKTAAVRPIDGNELVELLELMAEYQDTYKQSTILGVCQLIRWAKTLDYAPVIHAAWRHLGGDEWKCTSCFNVISTEGSWDPPTKKFCDECGAKMDLEVE